MSQALPPLIELEAFEAAARRGSFVDAATELHLSPSAVSHRVRSLESLLGVRLFFRHARRIELTEYGHAYLPSVRQAFSELARSTTSLFGSTDRDRKVTLRAPISFVVRCIAPRLAEFTGAHPHIQIQIASAIWADTPSPETTDIEVRLGDGNWPGWRAESFGEEWAGPVWTAEFEAQYGAVTSLEDLTRRPHVLVLGYGTPQGSPPVPNVAEAEAAITVDTSMAAIEIVRSGAYSAFLPLRFVNEFVASGAMLTLPSAHSLMSEAHYLLFAHGPQPPSPQAMLFAGWLRATLSR